MNTRTGMSPQIRGSQLHAVGPLAVNADLQSGWVLADPAVHRDCLRLGHPGALHGPPSDPQGRGSHGGAGGSRVR